MKEHFKIAFELAFRDLRERYVNTSFGQLWLLISPLVTILIYTVIFSDFMKMRMNLVESKYAYSIYLIPGLLSWNFFAVAVSRISNTFFEKAHLIKKVNIPTFVYYIATFISEFVIYIISMVFGVLFLVVIGQHIGAEFLWLPMLMLLVGMFAFFLGVIFSLFNPFFRDLKEIIPIILQLWFWMTPIIYVKELIYHKYPFLVDFNPFYYFIEPMQTLFLYSKVLYKDVAVSFAIVAVLAVLAVWLYKKMIAEIKDVI